VNSAGLCCSCSVVQYVAMCCSVLQCLSDSRVALYCSALQLHCVVVAVWCSKLHFAGIQGYGSSPYQTSNLRARVCLCVLVCVCVCVCMFVCLCVCIYNHCAACVTHIHPGVVFRKHACIWCTYICYTHFCICTHLYRHIYNIHMHINMRTHICCASVYIYTYTHMFITYICI